MGGSRSNSRRYALQILYQIDINSDDKLDKVFDNFFKNKKCADYTRTFTEKLVEGTIINLEDINNHIKNVSDGWSLDRIGKIEKAILQLSIYQILFCDDIPNKVAIDEGIELSKKYGDSNSYAFVNGMLDKLIKMNKIEKNGKSKKTK